MSAAATPRRRQSDADQDAAIAELACLTQQQRDILIYYAKGFTVIQTARLMGMKDKDVTNERSRIITALDCTMIEAAMTAQRAGLV